MQSLSFALVGLPGCGKSSVGRILASSVSLPFVDLDAKIVAQIGCGIADFFTHAGEAAFREIEAKAFAQAIDDGSAVVATGGGAVLSPATRALMQTRCATTYMHCTPALLLPRLRKDKTRPLLAVADVEAKLQELYEVRDPLYRDAACLVLDVAGTSAAKTSDAVLRAWQNRGWVPRQLANAQTD